MRSGAGEIIEVQGGHILRSTGRKDRHSKVCTAKGPRDRRVRLAANTAIQFYDVQDRLGFDRPSKAVDWLIKNAKAAIDELAVLPAWHPSPAAENSINDEPRSQQEHPDYSFGSGCGDRANSSFLPPSLVSDTIAETIRSFFPVSSADRGDCFPPELYSRKSHQSDDLRLSLHSIQDTTFEQSSPPQHHPLSFDTALAGFADQSQRIVSWNLADNGAADYTFSMAPMLFGQGHLSTQREPLQSSKTPLLRPWIDPGDQQMHQAFIPAASSAGFGCDSRSFPGFHMPARIHGEDELDGLSGKPSAASSASHQRRG